MNVLRNRHVLVAALVAPVLALIAYFAMDYLFGEPPTAAVEGRSYPLVETPGCRWESGNCGLKNNEFELNMVYRRLDDGQLRLQLESAFPLDGVMLAVVMSESDDRAPRPMEPEASDGRHWALDIRVPQPGTDRIRLVASADGALYFGDVATRFTLADPEGN